MYSLAKLLTEEPEKLERIGILFLKLLITLLIGSIFFDLNISVSGFIDNPIPKDYNITKFFLFLILLIVIWFLVWTIIGELIIGELIISLVSKIGNSKTIFYEVLSFLNVIKKNGDSISPSKHTIVFTEILNDYDDEDEKMIAEGKIRIRQYYLVIIITLISLLCVKDLILPTWLKWFGIIMSLNFLLVSVIFNKIHGYFKSNHDEMKKQFGKLAYSQMVINAIDQNPFLKNHYQKDNRWRRINLKRKTELNTIPESIKFYPFFHWNELLTKIVIDKALIQRSNIDFPSDKIGKHYDVVVCNVKPNQDNVKSILSQGGFAYLHCENEEQIYKNLEIFLFQISNGMYSLD